MTEQIYTWLKIYLETAGEVVDLTFYKFTAFGASLTQKEVIERILEIFEDYLKVEDIDLTPEQYKDRCTNMEQAYRALGIILPTLWW